MSPVALIEIRDLLLPGLMQSFYETKEIWAAQVLNSGLFIPETPHIWVPKLTLPQAVAAGAVAAIIKNPEVTRRFWAGWFSGD